jgi:hypothetical protein
VNNIEYQRVRESIGSQRDVARMLGVDIRTVQRREAGDIIITFEATRALFCLCAIEKLRGLIGQIKSDTVRHELGDVVVLLEAH